MCRRDKPGGAPKEPPPGRPRVSVANPDGSPCHPAAMGARLPACLPSAAPNLFWQPCTAVLGRQPHWGALRRTLTATPPDPTPPARPAGAEHAAGAGGEGEGEGLAGDIASTHIYFKDLKLLARPDEEASGEGRRRRRGDGGLGLGAGRERLCLL